MFLAATVEGATTPKPAIQGFGVRLLGRQAFISELFVGAHAPTGPLLASVYDWQRGKRETATERTIILDWPGLEPNQPGTRYRDVTLRWEAYE